jgi:hypothetical protein
MNRGAFSAIVLGAAIPAWLAWGFATDASADTGAAPPLPVATLQSLHPLPPLRPPLPVGLIGVLRPAGQTLQPLPAPTLHALRPPPPAGAVLPPLPVALRGLGPAVPASTVAPVPLLPPLPTTTLTGLGPVVPEPAVATLPPLPTGMLNGLGPMPPITVTPPLPVAHLRALQPYRVPPVRPPLPALLTRLGPVVPLDFEVQLPPVLTQWLAGIDVPSPTLTPRGGTAADAGTDCTVEWMDAPTRLRASCPPAPQYGLRLFDRVEAAPFDRPRSGDTVTLAPEQLTIHARISVPDAWFALRGRPTPSDATILLSLSFSDLAEAIPSGRLDIEQAVREQVTASSDLLCRLRLPLDDGENVTQLLSGSAPVAAVEPCVRVRLTYPQAWRGGATPAVTPKAAGVQCRADTQGTGRPIACVFDRSLKDADRQASLDWGAGFAPGEVAIEVPTAPAWEWKQALPAPTLALEDVLDGNGELKAADSGSGAVFRLRDARLCRDADGRNCCPSSIAPVPQASSVEQFGCEPEQSLPGYLRAAVQVEPVSRSTGEHFRASATVSVPLTELSTLHAKAQRRTFLGYTVAVVMTDPGFTGRRLRLYADAAACERDDRLFQQTGPLSPDPEVANGLRVIDGYYAQQQGAVAFADAAGPISACSSPGRLENLAGVGRVMRFEQPRRLVDDGPRTLVVLTASEDFGAANMRGISRWLSGWLEPRLSTTAPAPFQVLRLEPDGSIATLVDLSNLRRLEPAAAIERLRRIPDLAGRGQDPLRDLQTLEAWLQSQDLRTKMILYVTNARTGPFDRRLLGPPLAWQREGVRLAVLVATDQPQQLGGRDPCAPWRDTVGVVGSDCLDLARADRRATQAFLEQHLPPVRTDH